MNKLTLLTLLPLLLFVLLPLPLPAQHVSPATLTFIAIAGQTSPSQIMAFKNTGTEGLMVTDAITPPFVAVTDTCQNAYIRPGTHCNVWVAYGPLTVGEQDSGVLTIDYGSGSVQVALAGSGVQYIPAWLEFPEQKSTYKLGRQVSVTVNFYLGTEINQGYTVPYGKPVQMSCSNGSETVQLPTGTINHSCKRTHCPAPVHGTTEEYFTPDTAGQWICTASYAGDGEYGPSTAGWSYEITGK